MKDARTRKASNYFDKENQGKMNFRYLESKFWTIIIKYLETKMEELSRRGSMFLTNQGGRGSILMDANRRRTLSRQNEGQVHHFY